MLQITVMVMATVKYRQWQMLHLADKTIVSGAVEWYGLQWMATGKYSLTDFAFS